MQKVAIVTGAGTGVGKAVTLALAGDGYAVALAGRRAELLQATAAETKGGRTLVVPTDVCDPAAIATLFARTKEAFGRLDLLFNNAGMSGPGVPFEELSLAKWKQIVDTNLTATFLCCQEAFRIMKAQTPRGGRIINNGSISAQVPRPRSAPYTSTKHALTGLTKSLALDGRAYDIACGQIDIGNAATPMTDPMTRGVPQADGRVATEPRMDSADIGKAVLYMANLPLEANVLFMTVMATKMPFVGRG